jgi:hypothetical protein
MQRPPGKPAIGPMARMATVTTPPATDVDTVPSTQSSKEVRLRSRGLRSLPIVGPNEEGRRVTAGSHIPGNRRSLQGT